MELPRLRGVTPACAKPRLLKPCGGKSPRLRQPLRRAGTPFALNTLPTAGRHAA
jgi:hypothetical protein